MAGREEVGGARFAEALVELKSWIWIVFFLSFLLPVVGNGYVCMYSTVQCIYLCTYVHAQ